MRPRKTFRKSSAESSSQKACFYRRQRRKQRRLQFVLKPSLSSFPSVNPYCPRTALNVPCFEGLSPTSGANSTSPLIESGVPNFPLNINVPGSRPTLPSGNSTAPENVTEFWSPGVHFASEGFAGPHRLNIGSTSRNVPLPCS